MDQLTVPDTSFRGSRIATLDVIRGVAVMGILTVNIVAFAMPEVAYMNPAAFGGDGGADLVVWLLNFVLVDGKMRGLFSFLFGASMLLVIERATAKDESAAKVHFSRMMWLFLFGEAHLILLWWGDILHHYALVGCIAFAFRNAPPHKLIAAAIILLIVETLMVAGLPMSVHGVVEAMRAAQPSPEMIRRYQELRDTFGIPSPDALARELSLHRGPYVPIMQHRLHGAADTTLRTLIFVGPETLAYMLLGMAGLRTGMLTGEWSRTRYRRWVVIGFGTGVPAFSTLAWYVGSHGFRIVPVVLGVLTLPTPFRPVMIIGWACLIVLLVRPGGPLTARIAAAGRMAFSNYLGTSLICTTLFYGYGLGLYGHLSRAQLYPVVIALWVLMLLWSKPWLARFRFGPLEWLWRSLARMQVQPIRGTAAM